MKISLREIQEIPLELDFKSWAGADRTTSADEKKSRWIWNAIKAVDEAEPTDENRSAAVHFELSKVPSSSELFLVSGKIKSSLALVCSRCGETIDFGVAPQFSNLFAKASSVAAQTSSGKGSSYGGGQDLNEDFEITVIESTPKNQDEAIDLSDVLVEQLELARPLKPLCSEKCKGICSKCLQNLNEKECGCSNENTESPFHVLKNLRRKDVTT